MATTPQAETDDFGFYKAPFADFVIANAGNFHEADLHRLLVAAIESLDDAECEPCFKCGHTFADHQFAGDGGETKCELCTRHAFRSFPKNWGREIAA